MRRIVYRGFLIKPISPFRYEVLSRGRKRYSYVNHCLTLDEAKWFIDDLREVL